MTGDTPNECLPPDPSVPGLWWVHQAARDEWRVWKWNPWYDWDAFDDENIRCEEAHAAGWRCIAPAAPPSDDLSLSDEFRRGMAFAELTYAQNARDAAEIAQPSDTALQAAARLMVRHISTGDNDAPTEADIAVVRDMAAALR